MSRYAVACERRQYKRGRRPLTQLQTETWQAGVGNEDVRFIRRMTAVVDRSVIFVEPYFTTYSTALPVHRCCRSTASKSWL